MKEALASIRRLLITGCILNTTEIGAHEVRTLESNKRDAWPRQTYMPCLVCGPVALCCRPNYWRN
jgi:hypothetical protein